jgi:hypothetical protein
MTPDVYKCHDPRRALAPLIQRRTHFEARPGGG